MQVIISGTTYTVASVDSDTQITLTEEIPISGAPILRLLPMQVLAQSNMAIESILNAVSDPLNLSTLNADTVNTPQINVTNTFTINPPGTFTIDPNVTIRVPGVGAVNNVLFNQTYVSNIMQTNQLTQWVTDGFDHAGVPAVHPGLAGYPDGGALGPLQIFSIDAISTIRFQGIVNNSTIPPFLTSEPCNLDGIADMTVIETFGFLSVNNIYPATDVPPLTDYKITFNSTTANIYFNYKTLEDISSLDIVTLGSVSGPLTIDPTVSQINMNSVVMNNVVDVTLNPGNTLYTNSINTASGTILDFNGLGLNNVGNITVSTGVFTTSVTTPIVQSISTLQIQSGGGGDVVLSSDVSFDNGNLTNVQSINVVGGSNSTFNGNTIFNGLTTFSSSSNVNIIVSGGGLVTIGKDTTFTSDCALSLGNANFADYPKIIGIATITGATGALLGIYYSPSNPTITSILCSRASPGIYTITLTGGSLSSATHMVKATCSRTAGAACNINASISSATTIDIFTTNATGFSVDPTEINLCVFQLPV